MENRIKCLYYEVGEPIRIISPENKLSTFQELVGGHIEVAHIGTDGEEFVAIINEEGRMLDLPNNGVVELSSFHRVDIQGSFLVCRVDGEDFASLKDIESAAGYVFRNEKVPTGAGTPCVDTNK